MQGERAAPTVPQDEGYSADLWEQDDSAMSQRADLSDQFEHTPEDPQADVDEEHEAIDEEDTVAASNNADVLARYRDLR